MSRKANCWDNTVVESFFHSLKTELIYLNSFENREQAQGAIFEFIDVFYNRPSASFNPRLSGSFSLRTDSHMCVKMCPEKC